MPEPDREPETEREGRWLSRARVAARANAYLYGNMMALAALAGAARPGEVVTGHALFVLVMTGCMTLLAHGLAHHVETVVRYGEARRSDELRRRIGAELRDSLPIATSVALPALLLLPGVLGWSSETTATNLAIGVIVLRFLGLGWAIGWHGSRRGRPTLSALRTGIGLAALAVGIALAKTLLTH